MLLKVDNNAIRRMKSHMLEFFSEPSIGCILGTNGYVWIYANCYSSPKPSPQERLLMATLRNCIVALEKAKLPIYKETILQALDAQAETDIQPKDILANYELITAKAKETTDKELAQKKPINFQNLLD